MVDQFLGDAHVLVIGEIPDALLALVRSEFLLDVLDPADLSGPQGNFVLEQATGLLAAGDLLIDESLLARAPRLRVVSLRAVGYDKVDLDACRSRGIAVCHTPGVLEGAVADLTVLLLLALTRRLEANLAAGRGGWYNTGERPPLGVDVRGKTLGILGMGGIGARVAETLHFGFGMDVIYHSRSDHPRTPPLARRVDRDQLFQECDFLSIHLPLSDQTRKSVGEREFGLMQPHSLIINTSRGAVIDEAALIRALDAGEIAGAGIDVTASEPLHPSSRLCELPNVVVTPHVGSATVETRAAMAELSYRNLLAIMRGEGSAHRVA